MESCPVVDDYIPVDLHPDQTFHHVALEGAIRAIEDDLSVPPYIGSHYIDPRSMRHIASLQAMHDLVTTPGFEVDLWRTGDREPTYTPYRRFVKRGFRTDQLMVQSTKGWIVLGHVDTCYSWR